MLTYFLDANILHGSSPINFNGKQLRQKIVGLKNLGLKIQAHPSQGIVHYSLAELTSNAKNLQNFIQFNQTTMIDIVIKRVIKPDIFSLTTEQKSESFKNIE